MKIKLLSILALSMLLGDGYLSYAQDDEPGDFTAIFRGAPEDATRFLEQYMGPGMLSFSNGMAGGWVNTANTHKPGGLDLTFTLNVANMPVSERIFTFNPAEYDLLSVVGATGPSELPTLVGGGTNADLQVTVGDQITVGGTTYEYVAAKTFPAPPGFDLEDVPFVGVPVPSLQLGVGLFKNTDLKLRYIPEQTFDSYSFKLFGFGILHDVKQWIPGIRQVPLDISLFIGTTSMSAEFEFEAGDPNGITDDFYVTNGLAEFDARATTFQIVASKKLSFFTPYMSIGINSVNTSIEVNGDYTLFSLQEIGNSTNLFSYNTVSGTDAPVTLDFNGGGGIRTTVGFRLRLLFLTLHTDYTFQKYNTFTLGFGFSFRENK